MPSATDFLGTTAPKTKPAAKSAADFLGPAPKADSSFDTKGLTSAYESVRGMNPEIDYDTGAKSFFAKWLLERSDNPQEAKLALSHYYGPDNVGQDEAGRYWVRENGKRVEVFGGGQGFETAFRKLPYQTLAYSPVLGGALTGAVIGGAAGSEAPVVGNIAGGIIGAGLGAGAGKAVDEFSKKLAGLYAKTPYEEIKTIGHEALFNAAFEALGPASKATIGKIMPWLRKHYLEVTPEISARTSRLVKGGAIPPIETALPGAKVTEYHQRFRNAVMGDPKAHINQAYVEQRSRQLLYEAGVHEDEIDGVLKDIRNPDAARSGTPVGEQVVSNVKSHIESLTAEHDAAIESARNATLRMDKLMARLANLPQGRLAEDVAGAISKARGEFGTAMERAYDHVDTLAGGKPIVPTGPVKREAKKIADLLPETQRPALINEISQLDENITIKDAHRIRTKLRAAAQRGSLTPGLTEHDFDEVAKGMDVSISMAGRNAPEAVKMLNAADRAYAEGIAKFKDQALNAIVRRMRTGIAPDPREVVESFIKPGETERLNVLWKMASPDLKRQIAATDMAAILKDANGSGKQLIAELDKRGGMLDTVYGSIYGKKFVADLKQHAKELAAIDGKYDFKSLDPGLVSAGLQRAKAVTDRIDAFVKQSPLAALGNPKTADRAANDILQPGREGRTEAVRNFLGPESNEWKQLQRHALSNLLSELFRVDKSGEIKIAGTALQDELSKYTQKQQDMLFPDGLAADIRTLAKDAHFLFPRYEDDMGLSLKAAELKAKLPRPDAIMRYIWTAAWGKLYDSPALIRYFGVLKAANVPMLTRKKLFSLLVVRPALAAGPSNEQAQPQ